MTGRRECLIGRIAMDLTSSRQTISCSESSPISWENVLCRPFQLAVENKKNKLLYGNYTEENCIYQHRDALKYLNQFMAAYMGENLSFSLEKMENLDKPKFAWLWSSLQSHDYESSSVRLDTDLYEFMMFHKEQVTLPRTCFHCFLFQLDNSFVVLMGDHGLRFGKVRNDFSFQFYGMFR